MKWQLSIIRIICTTFNIVRVFLYKPKKTKKYSGAKSKAELSEEQLSIFNDLDNSTHHSFVTGKAGTGKSVLLQYFAENTHKQVIKLAPTGIAAMNIKGQTIHSFFKLPPGFINNKVSINKETKDLIKHVDVVIIDEISMVRVDTIDAIDFILRKSKKIDVPFGGIQLILFGDVYQLPPVIEGSQVREYLYEKYGEPYFFNAKVWDETTLCKYELQTVFRQSDKRFKAILNAIRIGKPTVYDFTTLNTRLISQGLPASRTAITLTSTNSAAQRINAYRCNELKTRSQIYYAFITGKIAANAFPTESVLSLSIGAQVMFLKNDISNRWANGTIGKIVSFSQQSVRVAVGAKIFQVYPVIWEKYNYTYDDEKELIEQVLTSTFTQLPLKLAWAITIHKSQGCTYSSVIVDLSGGAFAHGQTYVALSRCTSLSGLYLRSPIKASDIIVEPAILQFMGVRA